MKCPKEDNGDDKNYCGWVWIFLFWLGPPQTTKTLSKPPKIYPKQPKVTKTLSKQLNSIHAWNKTYIPIYYLPSS